MPPRVAGLVWVLFACGGAPARAQEPTPAPPADAPPRAPAEALEGVEAVPARLAHAFRPGAKLLYGTRQTTVVREGAMSPMTTTSVFELEREVIEAAPEGAVLADTFVHLVQESALAGRTITLDTRDGTVSGDPMVDAMGALAGGRLQIKVGRDGRVASVEGGRALRQRVLAACPEVRRDLMSSGLEMTLDDAALMQQAQETLVLFPEEEQQPGATWRRAVKLKLGFLDELDKTIDYVYLGQVDRGGVRCAKLWSRVRVAGVENRDTMIQGQALTVSLDPFQGECALLVRLDDGALLESGPLKLAYGMTLRVQGQELQASYELVTRMEARSAPPAAPVQSPR